MMVAIPVWDQGQFRFKRNTEKILIFFGKYERPYLLEEIIKTDKKTIYLDYIFLMDFL